MIYKNNKKLALEEKVKSSDDYDSLMFPEFKCKLDLQKSIIKEMKKLLFNPLNKIFVGSYLENLIAKNNIDKDCNYLLFGKF